LYGQRGIKRGICDADNSQLTKTTGCANSAVEVDVPCPCGERQVMTTVNGLVKRDVTSTGSGIDGDSRR
jgi:hypothetical protein